MQKSNEMVEKYSTYLTDLSVRQNRPVTESEIHLYLTAKKYYKNDIEECSNLMKGRKQVDLTNKDVPDIIKRQPKIEIEKLQEELLNKEEELKEIKLLNLFVYQKKIILLDEEKNILKLKYKEDLFDDLIYEFTKLYNWLDNRGSYLKFNDDNDNPYVIDKTEIKTVIHFFDKLNKIKKD